MKEENPETFIAMGVDQGLASVGYGTIVTTYKESGTIRKIISSGTIKTPSTDKKPERLLAIHKKLMHEIDQHEPDAMGCEKLFFNPPQKAENRNKSASIVTTSQATGMVILTAGISGLPLYSFVPGTVKKQVAKHGSATKEQMKEALREFCEENGVEIKSEHQGDALAIALTMSILHEQGMLEESKQE